MPCWEVRTVTLDLANADPAALRAALDLHPGVQYRDGQLVGQDLEELGEAKREYSAQLAEQTLRKQGWVTQRKGYQVVAKRKVYGGRR